MTRQTLLLLTVLLLTGCSSQAPFTPQASEIAAVQTATSQSVAPTATRATLSTPSATNAPTSSMELTAVPSPFPAETESLLSKKCDKPWESVPGFDLPDELIEDYGDRGCKLPVLSPNRAYLAYVTLTRQPEQGAGQDGYVDTVRILHTHTGKDQVVRFAEGLSPIDSLEWSPTGQLIIQERLWEGPRVVFVYDPSRDAMVSAMRLDQDGNLEWNSERTAMVAVHSGEYGSDQCIHELGGYDFEHGQPFPDLYAIYGITKTDDPFGIPYGASDALSVEPYGWSKDGQSLWITISRLTLIESTGEYEVGPKQAGALSFSDDGVSFNTLAANPQFDYSFDGGSEPRVVSEPYQPRRCP